MRPVSRQLANCWMPTFRDDQDASSSMSACLDRAVSTYRIELATVDDAPPIVFLTGHGDIPMTVRAMKAGAVDFLTKPVRDQTLLDAVTAGIEQDIARRSETLLVKKHVERLATLHPA